MKVLFLDVDGVLNSGGVREALEEYKLWRVARIREATGCEIVVSSTWRCYPHRLGRLTDALWMVGIRIEGAIPDRSRLVGGRFIREPRGWEIQDWLDCRDDVIRIAILDDAGDMAHLDPFLIRTDMADGLTDEDADRCIQLLDGEQDAGVWAPGAEAEARGGAGVFPVWGPPALRKPHGNQVSFPGHAPMGGNGNGAGGHGNRDGNERVKLESDWKSAR